MAGHASSGATATRSSDSDDRVGIVSWDYGECARGGLGRAMAQMARVLRARLAIPALACPANPNRAGLRLSRMARRVVGFRVLFMLWVLFGLQRWIDVHRLRTVILPTGPGGLFLRRKPNGCRLVIVSYHTYWQQAQMVPGQWWKMLMVPWERRALVLADRILCYCADTQRVLLEVYGLPEDRVRLLPQLLDCDAWNSSLPASRFPLPAKEPGLCVFVGRLDRRKGINVLLRAWERLQTYQYAGVLIHRPQLVIVGDGPYRREVRSLAAQSASVQWMPSLSWEELAELVRRAEVALCPSYLEGFGLACAEAMAARTCVIASDCDGLRSLVNHKETGWLVRPGDPEALASSLHALLRDAALRMRLAEAARDYVRLRFARCDAARRLVLECAGI